MLRLRKAFALLGVLSALSSAATLATAESPAPVNLLPLAGSRWARSHPGHLPYEQCALHEAPAGSGEARAPETPPLGTSAIPGTVTCWSTKLGVAFKIPVEIRAVDLPHSAQLATQVLWPGDLTVEPRDGHRVDEIFGPYHGWQASVGVGVGGTMQRLRNSAGARLSALDGGLLLGLKVGQIRLEISPRDRITEEECSGDAYLILGETTRRRTPSDCGLYGAPVHFGDLGRAEFQRVK